MIDMNNLYILKNGPTPEELGRLACTGGETHVMLTRVTRTDDGGFAVAPDKPVELTLRSLNVCALGADPALPVEINAEIAAASDDILIGEMKTRRGAVSINYNVACRCGVVCSFACYQRTHFRWPDECPRGEKAERERIYFLRLVGCDNEGKPVD